MLQNSKNSLESRRVRMTKTLIKKTLAELLQEKGICAVTVKELCQCADINRSTFYAHYEDVFAVLRDIERDFIKRMPLFSNSTPTGNDKRAQRQRLLEYVNYVRDNRSTFIALCDNGLLSNALYDHVLKPDLDIFAPGVSDPELYRLLVCQINTGTNAMLLQWFKSDAFSPEEIVEIILNSLPSPRKILNVLAEINYSPKSAGEKRRQ